MKIVIVEKDNTRRTRETAAKAALKLSATIIRPVDVIFVHGRQVQILPWYSEKEAIQLIEDLGNAECLQAV